MEETGVYKPSKLNAYAESYLIAGAFPALLFPFAGMATSYLQMTFADDFETCVSMNAQLQESYFEKEHLSSVLRTFSTWYYVYGVIYMMLVFKPNKYIYKASGILMTITFLTGYAIFGINFAFLNTTSCEQSIYFRVGAANQIIFIVVGTFVFVFAHILIFISFCASCCSRKQDKIEAEQYEQPPPSQQQEQEEEEKPYRGGGDIDEMEGEAAPVDDAAQADEDEMS